MFKQPAHYSPLRIFNNLLTVLVIILGFYLIFMPLWPQISFWLNNTFGSSNNPYQSILSTDDSKKNIPKENRLVIPQMNLDAVINDGPYAGTLKKGLWRRPSTSTPEKSGNTVIVGHRFTYRGPAIFYHLDVLKVNDSFSLYWNGKEYAYKVREVKVVEPNETSVEGPTTQPTLTLYTCTPMWTSKQRLVVVADLIKEAI